MSQTSSASSPPLPSSIIIACRKSDLALVQVRKLIPKFQSPSPTTTYEVTTRSVAGDADKESPFLALSKMTGGSDVGKSLWTNGLEVELLSGKVHVLVHCLKDMPTTLPPKCVLGAIPEREDATDAAIMKLGSQYTSIDQLPPGSVVGSSSSRRRALIKRNWPHLEVAECRGNLDTRLAKLDAPDSLFSCILLATAGLVRLGLQDRITQRLDPKIFPYAVGQGALGIEIQAEDQNMLQLVRTADHMPSRWRGMAERAMLRSLQGGCSSPIGVYCFFDPADATKLHLNATVLDTDGSKEISAESSQTVSTDDQAEQLGVIVADELRKKGASDLLSKLQ